MRWGEQHYLQALDAATGEPLWRADLGGYDAAAPVVAGDTVYVASVGAGLAALGADTGRQRWFLPLGEAELSAPLVAGERVYVAEQLGPGRQLLTLDRSSGWRVWAHSLRHLICGSLPPLAAFGHIYVADGTQLLALSPEDGSMRVVLRADDWIAANSPRARHCLILLPSAAGQPSCWLGVR